jgi:hypothetical protein
LELSAGKIIEHSPKGYFVVKLKYVEPLMSTPHHTIVIGPTRYYIIPRREGHEAARPLHRSVAGTMGPGQGMTPSRAAEGKENRAPVCSRERFA